MNSDQYKQTHKEFHSRRICESTQFAALKREEG